MEIVLIVISSVFIGGIAAALVYIAENVGGIYNKLTQRHAYLITYNAIKITDDKAVVLRKIKFFTIEELKGYIENGEKCFKIESITKLD